MCAERGGGEVDGFGGIRILEMLALLKSKSKRRPYVGMLEFLSPEAISESLMPWAKESWSL